MSENSCLDWVRRVHDIVMFHNFTCLFNLANMYFLYNYNMIL